ncbi:MAG: MarR family transcriptional regulator [Nitriliruptoraceae bacterium]
MPEDAPTVTVSSPEVGGAGGDEPRWLDDGEQHAWRQLATVILRLPSELEAQLQRDAGMSYFEYWAMALLSEAPDHTLRMSQLASQANASLSRLSHVVSRLEKREWVTRRPCPDDARATLAVLTELGWDQVVATAPGHAAAVRRLVFDGFEPDEVDELDRLCGAILARIEAPDPPSRADGHTHATDGG